MPNNHPTLYESLTQSSPRTPPERPRIVTEDYADKKWKAESYNRSQYQQLLDLREQHKDDIMKRQEISVKIAQFARAIKNTPNPYRALFVDVSREIVMEHQPVSNWQD